MAKIDYKKAYKKKVMKKRKAVIAKRPGLMKQKSNLVKKIDSLETMKEHLKNIRLEKKISLEKLAIYCETSRQSLSKFENRDEDVKLRNLLKMIKFLGLRLYIGKGSE